MKKLFLILNLICFQAAAANLVSFNEMAGNYIVESCLGRSKLVSLNYCHYSNLSILEVPGQPTQSQFIFSSEETEALRFTVDTNATFPAWKDLDSNQITLMSEMGQDRSKIILQNFGTRKLLILQSESKDSSFKYFLILK